MDCDTTFETLGAGIAQRRRDAATYRAFVKLHIVEVQRAERSITEIETQRLPTFDCSSEA